MNIYLIPLITALFIAGCPGSLGPDDQVSLIGNTISNGSLLVSADQADGRSILPAEERCSGGRPSGCWNSAQLPAAEDLWIAALVGSAEPLPAPQQSNNKWLEQQGLLSSRPRIHSETGPPQTTVWMRDEKNIASRYLAA